MPYTLDNPPDAVKNLPKKAQKLFIEAFNAVVEGGGSEEEARKAGWANVKREYKKSGEEWIEKSAGPGDKGEAMATELRNIDVRFISLVKKGANRKQIIVKAADFETADATFSRVIKIEKIDAPKRMIYGLVYSPNVDCPDTDDEFATAEEIEKACERFMKEGLTPNVDRSHSWEKEDGAFVKESWIVKSGDPLFPADVDAWAVGIKVEKDEIWEEVEKGEIGGLSLGGYAEKVGVEKSRGEGQGAGGGRQGDGGADICVCPSCGATTVHEKSKTCKSIKCPECGTPMEGADMEINKEDLSFMAKLGGALRSVIQKESATFDEVVDAQQFWQMFYALENSCAQIINDEELDHGARMAKIAESLDQFKKQFATLKTEKVDASQVEKEGKVFSKANYEKLMGVMETLQKLLGAAEAEKSTKEEKQMDLEKAMQELTERVEKIEKGEKTPPAPPAAAEPTEMEKALKAIQDRLEKLENPEAPGGEPPAVAPEVEALQKSVKEIADRLEKLEKPEGETTEKSEAVKAIEKSLADIGTRLEKIEKARGISQKGEPGGEEPPAPKTPLTGQVTPKTKHFGC